MIGVVPPFPFTQFSLRPKLSQGETIAVVNRLVNLMRPHEGAPSENDPYLIAPEHGTWCHDYAVTKQWLLAAFGIESKLCECVLPDGEHHMVLLVADVALDNLTPVIGPMKYPVVKTESDDPRLWDAP